MRSIERRVEDRAEGERLAQLATVERKMRELGIPATNEQIAGLTAWVYGAGRGDPLAHLRPDGGG